MTSYETVLPQKDGTPHRERIMSSKWSHWHSYDLQGMIDSQQRSVTKFCEIKKLFTRKRLVK